MPVSPVSGFSGKVALVTGAGKGLGRATALALAAQGARVAINDISPINLDETLALIRSAGGEGRDYVFDAAKRLPVEALVHEVITDFGRVDILVTCARVYTQAPLLDLDEWDWQRVLDVNLSGAFFALQLAGRQMRLQGKGAVVFVAALPSEGDNRAAAIASQAALVELARQASAELAPHGVRVNAVGCQGKGAETNVVRQVLEWCAEDCPVSGQVIWIHGNSKREEK